MQQDDIRFSIHGRAGLVLIDRPKALNALSFDMAVALRDQLAVWAEDEAVGHVVMAGSEARAFCAGGDIRDLYNMAVAGDHDGIAVCFRAEYMAHMAVSEFPTPLLSLAYGFVMGGGAGLMQAGSHAMSATPHALRCRKAPSVSIPTPGRVYSSAAAPGRLPSILA